MKIYNIEILKRTFEGINDPKFNNDVLTSKYSPSKKWLLRYRRDGYDHIVNETFKTKKLAEQRKINLTN